MLKLSHIGVTFTTSSGSKKEVLKDLNLTVESGEFVLVLGDNGTGKSTLFNVISGFTPVTSGSIDLADKDITKLSYIERAGMIAHVMQDPSLGTLAQLSIFENMVFASKRGQARQLLPYSQLYDREYFKKHLAVLGLGLENRLDEPVEGLSGGQRQALSVAMALLQQPKLLLLDEITAALDQETGSTLMKIINTLVHEKKCTVLMITHNLQHAREYGDRVVVLKQGKIVKEYSCQEKKSLSQL